MKYLRLLRLQDQYIQFGTAFAAGLYLNIRDWRIFYWAISSTCISITAFMVNELTDRKDVDIYSWNAIHIGKDVKFNNLVLTFIFVTLSLTGLYIAYLISLFWWGLTMYIIGLSYSLKPIRLKGKFILDILSQLAVWLIIPFLAPISLYTDLITTAPFILIFALIYWSICFPYQLADFTADLKSGIRPTHVVLGMRNSLIFGAILAILGIYFYFKLNIYLNYPWSIVFLALTCYLLYLYIKWLGLNKIANQIKSMQKDILIIKPLTQLLVPYLVIWYSVIIPIKY